MKSKDYLKAVLKSKQMKQFDSVVYGVTGFINKFKIPFEQSKGMGFEMSLKPKGIEGVLNKPSKSEIKFLKLMGK